MRRTPFRIVDTGLNSAEVNIAMDRHWLAAHVQGERDNLLRFHRSTPSAWVGLHQWPERELRLHFCHRKGIDVVRRLTGGGTLYVDPQQLGFSLILKWSERLAELGESGVIQRGCDAVVSALRGLGVAAAFKAPNDIEVAGRKLASLYASRDRGSFLLQAVLLMTADATRMQGALRLPSEPAVNGQVPRAASERLTALDQVCSRTPTPARIRKALTVSIAAQFNLRAESSTKTVYAQLREGFANATWPAVLDHQIQISTATTYWRTQAETMAELAEALWVSPAGLLRTQLRWDPLRHVPGWLEIGGSVQVQPLDLFARLARGLAGVNRNELATELQKQCVSAHAHLIGFTQDDLLAVLTRAWDRAEQQRDFGLSMEQSNRLTVVNAPGPAANAATLMQQADTLLLPYCTRPLECRDKSLDECRDCTGCEVGTACRAAASQSLNIRELKHYVELDGLLENLRAEGSKGVVGMTCQTFFIKHSDAFTRAGLPVLLVDLGGTTCYELQQEAAGYSGHFPHKTTLDTQVLEKLVRVRKAG